ncbi:MAG: hypothetical protein QOE17_1289, partial [Gaiellales bacterium]|nr:hypothetical protein [Gaiellales bacterium]
PSRVLAAAGVAALVLIAVLAFVLTSGGSDTAGGGSSNGSSGGGGSGGKPTAVPDTLTAGPTPTTFSADALTSNDTDPDGGGLKLVEATPTDGTKGMVGFSDGQVTYHAGGFVGTDTFSYVVEDGSGDRATGQATVVVSADGGGGSDVTFSPSQQYLLDHMPAQLANTCKPVKTADQYFKADVGAQGAVFCSPTNSGISSVTYFKFRTPGLAEASFSDFFNGYPTGLASDCKSKYSNKSTWKYKGVRGQVGCYHTSAPNFELDWTYTTFPIYGVVTGNTRCATCQANVYTWWVRQPNP